MYFLCLVDGGWREGRFSDCSTCGTGSNGVKSMTKYCDDPKTAGGDMCPCNATNPSEKSCDGEEAIIEEVCVNEPCSKLLNC